MYNKEEIYITCISSFLFVLGLYLILYVGVIFFYKLEVHTR